MLGSAGWLAWGQAACGAPAEHHKRVRVPCTATPPPGTFVFVNDISRERLFCNIDGSGVTEVQGNESNSRVKSSACSPIVDEARSVQHRPRAVPAWVNGSLREKVYFWILQPSQLEGGSGKTPEA